MHQVTGIWDGLCRAQQSPKHTAQPRPMRESRARHPAALPCKEQTRAASTAQRTHPPKLWETLRALFPFTLCKFYFTVKCFSVKAVLSKGSGDTEQPEPQIAPHSSLVAPLPAALGSANKPISLMGLGLGPWAGLSPTMLTSVTVTSHRTFLHLKAKCSIPETVS